MCFSHWSLKELWTSWKKNDDVLDSKPINQSKPSFPHHFPCHFPSDFPCFRLTSKLQGPDVLVCCSRAGNVYAEEWGAPLCAVPVTVARRWDRRKTDMTIRHVKLILFRTFNGNSSSTFDDINDTFTIIYHIVIQILFMFTFLFNHIWVMKIQDVFTDQELAMELDQHWSAPGKNFSNEELITQPEPEEAQGHPLEWSKRRAKSALWLILADVITHRIHVWYIC